MMASHLVDSSVLLDIFTADPVWAEWSVRELEKAWADGTVFVDPIGYSEISIRFSRIEDLEAAVAESGLVWSEVPREALFLAGKAFMSYRKAGGTRTSPLPAFSSERMQRCQTLFSSRGIQKESARTSPGCAL